MEQITGRIVKDAEIKKTKNGRELVAFTVAVNDRYKPKDQPEVKETRFFSCAYWLSTRVQKALKQGTLVSVFGRVNLNAYESSDGKYHSSLTFHTNYIEIITGAKKEAATANTGTGGKLESNDDLPF